MTIRCAECQRRFVPPRRDAVYCSTACRVKAWRHRDHEVPPAEEVSTAVDTSLVAEAEEVVTTVTTPLVAELEGWRRLPGGLLAPPPDPRLTVFVDPNDLRRLSHGRGPLVRRQRCCRAPHVR
jgi:hypothetical protein